MDKLFIHGLKVLAKVGILPHEKTCVQPVVIDFQCHIDAHKIAFDDDIAKTLNYVEVRDEIAAYLDTHRFQLVETLAHRLAENLINRFGLTGLQLKVTKPSAIPESDGTGILITRP